MYTNTYILLPQKNFILISRPKAGAVDVCRDLQFIKQLSQDKKKFYMGEGSLVESRCSQMTFKVWICIAIEGIDNKNCNY